MHIHIRMSQISDLKSPIYRTKRLFLFLFFVLFSVNTYSQEFKLILIGGINASQINGDDLAGFDQFGLNAGAGIMRELSPRTGLQFEMLYSQKGSKDEVDKGNLLQDSSFRVNYIDIPLLFNYRYKEVLSFQGGLSAGILLNASFDDHIDKVDNTTDYALIDYAVTGGIEYRFYNQFSANLRLTQSLISTNKTQEYYNLFTSLTLRYTFQ
jgi:hypothetical protein